MQSRRCTRIVSGLLDERAGSTQDLAQRLVDGCVATVGVSGVGLVLMRGDNPSGVVAASDRAATVMEDLQFTLGVGPCVHASRTGHPVLVPDLARAGPARWPAFTEGALAAGIRAVFAYPLRVGAVRLGVLDLYRDRPGMLTDAEHRLALDHADAATAVVLHLQSQPATPGSTDGHGDPVVSALLDVVTDRAEVHQATGLVAVQSEVGMPEALSLLRARSYATGRPMLDLARDVLARRLTYSSSGEPSTGGSGQIEVHETD
ncbi:GAF and ANTAR domain-containing protein [Aquipuribacter sp. MA13-6]|uniref:GAF and ANTAR domain-containing protein n=1 Tax=unclassified Aquipuribacter TaxID=2635084 RepID=UPI003EE99241